MARERRNNSSSIACTVRKMSRHLTKSRGSSNTKDIEKQSCSCSCSPLFTHSEQYEIKSQHTPELLKPHQRVCSGSERQKEGFGSDDAFGLFHFGSINFDQVISACFLCSRISEPLNHVVALESLCVCVDENQISYLVSSKNVLH